MQTEIGAAISAPSKRKLGGRQALETEALETEALETQALETEALETEVLETMVDLLRARRTSSLDAAFTFLQDDKVVAWSYGELDRRARAVAARLQEQQAAGRTVLLLFAPGLDFVA